MQRLTIEQSNLLKKLNLSSIQYSDLSESEERICGFLIDLDFVHLKKTPRVSTYNGITQVWDKNDTVSITENGKQYLINEQISDDRQHNLEEQVNSLKKISDSAKTQADIAVKISKKADIKGWIAVIVSIIGLTIEIVVNFPEISAFISCLL